MEKKRKNFLVGLLLLCSIPLLTGQALSLAALEKSAKKTYFGSGISFGLVMQSQDYSGILLNVAFNLSFQHGKELYSVRYMIASMFDSNEIQEYSLMYGHRRKKRAGSFSYSAGLGIVRGFFPGGPVNRIGVPLELQACLTLSSILSISIQAHAFIWKHPYLVISLGLQIGKSS